MSDQRALLRESLVWSAPAALALAVLAAFGQVGLDAVVGGWLVSFLAGGWLARGRLRELHAIAVWIESLPRGQDRPGLPEQDGTVTSLLLRPVVELGRVLRRQSRSMAAQQRMLGTVIEALPDPVLLVSRELIVLQANAAAQRSFEAPERPVPLARILRDPGLLAAVSGALAGTASSGFTFSPTQDRTKQFSCRIVPVELGENGDGVLVAMREQTEQVMIERMRSDFVANASHEIRTPLATIQGFIETLRGPARHDPKAQENFLEIMGEEAARMARLVDDLLSLSRVELAAHQPPQEPCALDEVLRHVAARVSPLAEASRVTVRLELGEALPLVIGDADQLHQLFVNLVDNAIKYGGEGKDVRIVAAALPAAPPEGGPLAGRPSVHVVVIDEGPGIAKEDLPRITERFYRVDKARSRKLRGTGLGLAIAKHIVRRHQGHLAIASEVGRGSSFTVYLPVAGKSPPLS
jgi:two-component system phosphate regulon sensor histidine kinase PhoR